MSNDYCAAINKDARDISELAQRVVDVTGQNLDFATLLASPAGSFLDQEQCLDDAAWSLRKHWLALAQRPADISPKSPLVGQHAHVASGGNVEFGYERELDVSLL